MTQLLGEEFPRTVGHKTGRTLCSEQALDLAQEGIEGG